MISKVVSIGGKEYLVKYPIGALIKAEKLLGWKLTELKERTKDMSIGDMAILVRCGLRNLSGEAISDTDFQDIMDTVDTQEFLAIVPDVLSVFSGNSQASTKTKQSFRETWRSTRCKSLKAVCRYRSLSCIL